MGGTSSTITSSSQTLNNNITNRISQNITSSCSNKLNNIQSINIEGVNIVGCTGTIGGTMDTNSTFNPSCVNASVIKDAVSSAVSQEIQSQLSNKADGFQALFTSSSSVANQTTAITTDLTNSNSLNNVEGCIANQSNKQSYNFSNSTITCVPMYDANGNFVPGSTTLNINPYLNIVSTMVSQCVNNADLGTQIKNAAQSTSGSTISNILTGPLQDLTQMFNSPGFIITVVIIVALVIGGLWLIFGGSEELAAGSIAGTAGKVLDTGMKTFQGGQQGGQKGGQENIPTTQPVEQYIPMAEPVGSAPGYAQRAYDYMRRHIPGGYGRGYGQGYGQEYGRRRYRQK